MRADVEWLVAKALAEDTGLTCALEVPDPRPDEFVSVELTGGTGSRFKRDVTLAVQSWAQTRVRAAEIAMEVEDACLLLVRLPQVFRSVPTETYRFPDPDSAQERYQTTLELTICD